MTKDLTVDQQIEYLVKIYADSSNKKLFRLGLKLLVNLAERDQMVKDHKSTIKALKGE